MKNGENRQNYMEAGNVTVDGNLKMFMSLLALLVVLMTVWKWHTWSRINVCTLYTMKQIKRICYSLS